MLAIDISYWTGTVSVETFRKFKEAGYDLVVVGLWHGGSLNRHAYSQLENALAAGLLVAGYIALSGIYPPALQVSWGQVAVQGPGGWSFWPVLRFVSIDVELDGVSVQDIRTAVSMVSSLGQRVNIYTARWFWMDHMGNPQDLCDVPLWNAFYDSDPDVDFPMWPYGCWERSIGVRAGQRTQGLIGEQYKGTTTLFGTVVDVNWFDPAYVLGEEEMTEDQIRALAREEMDRRGFTEERGKDIGWVFEAVRFLRDFVRWWGFFPTSQKEKDDATRQAGENSAAQTFYDRQIGWRTFRKK